MLFTFSPWIHQNTDTALPLNCSNGSKYVLLGCVCVMSVVWKERREDNKGFFLKAYPIAL